MFQFRYNSEARLGEVKVDREYRQKCPVHGGEFVSPLLGERGGARWIMARTARYIIRRFYGGGPGVVDLVRSRNSTGSSEGSEGDGSYGLSRGSPDKPAVSRKGSRGSAQDPEQRRQERRLPLYKPLPRHSREHCEACLLRRCPIPR